MSAAASKSPERALCARLCHRLGAGTGEQVLISAVSHLEAGRLKSNPEKRSSFITGTNMSATGELPLFPLTDRIHKQRYISRAEGKRWCEHKHVSERQRVYQHVRKHTRARCMHTFHTIPICPLLPDISCLQWKSL